MESLQSRMGISGGVRTAGTTGDVVHPRGAGHIPALHRALLLDTAHRTLKQAPGTRRRHRGPLWSFSRAEAGASPNPKEVQCDLVRTAGGLKESGSAVLAYPFL